jgi:hypothetical protein
VKPTDLFTSMSLCFPLLLSTLLVAVHGAPPDKTKFLNNLSGMLADAAVLCMGAHDNVDVLIQRGVRANALHRCVGNDIAACEVASPNQTVDWVLLAGIDSFLWTSDQALSFIRSVQPRTHYAVVVWLKASVSATTVFASTDFMLGSDMAAVVGNWAKVFYLKELFGGELRKSFNFSLAPVPFIPWTDTAVVSAVPFRVYVSEKLRADLAQLPSGGVVVPLLASPNRTRRNTIRATWAPIAKQSGVTLFFMIASPTLELLREADDVGDIMLFEAVEQYSAESSVLSLKTFGGLQVAAKHATRAQWFFKGDDDTFVNPLNLLKLIRTLPAFRKEHVYVGCQHDSAPIRARSHSLWFMAPERCKPHRYPLFMGGGSGILVKRHTVECVTHAVADPSWRYIDIEDLAMRLTLQAHCAPLLPLSFCDRIHDYSPSETKENYSARAVSWHHIAPKDMHVQFRGFQDEVGARSWKRFKVLLVVAALWLAVLGLIYFLCRTLCFKRRQRRNHFAA